LNLAPRAVSVGLSPPPPPPPFPLPSRSHYLFDLYAPAGSGAEPALPRSALWRLLRALLAALSAVGELGAEVDVADAAMAAHGATGVGWVEAGRLPPGVRVSLSTRADRAAEVGAAAHAFAGVVCPNGGSRVDLSGLVAVYNAGGSAALNFLELLTLKKWRSSARAPPPPASPQAAIALREDTRDVVAFAVTRDVRVAAALSEAEEEAEAVEAAADAAAEDAAAVAEADAAAEEEAAAAYEAASSAPLPPALPGGADDASAFEFSLPRASVDLRLPLVIKGRDCAALERVVYALPALELPLLMAFLREHCAERDDATGALVVPVARFPHIVGALVIDEEDRDCALGARDIRAAEVCLTALLHAHVPYGAAAAPLPEVALALALLAYRNSKSEKLGAVWALLDSRGRGALTLSETHRLFAALLTSLFAVTLWDELAFLVLRAGQEGAAVRSATAPLSRAEVARVRDAAEALGEAAYGAAVAGPEAGLGLTFDAFGSLYSELVATGGVAPRGAPGEGDSPSPADYALRATDYHVLELLDLKKWPLPTFEAALAEAAAEAHAEAEAAEDAEAVAEADAAAAEADAAAAEAEEAAEAAEAAQLAADLAEAEAEADAEESALDAEERALDAAEASFWNRVARGEASAGANGGDGSEEEPPEAPPPSVAALEARSGGAGGAPAPPRVDAATSVSSSSLASAPPPRAFDPAAHVFVFPLHRGVRLVIAAEDVLAARAQAAVSPLSALLASDLLALLAPRAGGDGMLPRAAYLKVVRGVVDAAADAYVERTGGAGEPLSDADVERVRSAVFTAKMHGEVLMRMFALLQEVRAPPPHARARCAIAPHNTHTHTHTHTHNPLRNTGGGGRRRLLSGLCCEQRRGRAGGPVR
jgi:hypothetical protein